MVNRDHERDPKAAPRPLPPRLDPRAGRPARGDAAGLDRGTAGPGRAGSRAAWIGRGVAAVLSVLLLSGTGWGWYLGRVADASVTRTDAIPTEGNGNSAGVREAMNLLLVGNDSRTALSEELQAELHTGGDSGLNTDTMILVHVPADGSKASFVSFPRDSFVAIPGHGNDKLNAAYAYGYGGAPGTAPEPEKRAAGARLLVQTISQLTGLGIDHYLEVDLLGFFNLSSVVGGVEVNLCKAVDDRKYSGGVFAAGPQTITGADALKFVRQRHGLPRGDFDRIVRQQVFMAGVMRKMVSQDVLVNPGKQRELIGAAAQSMTVDQNLDFFDLAQQMQSISPGSIDFQTIPNRGTDRDEQAGSIIRLEDETTLHAFFADLSAEPKEPEAAPSTEAPRTAAPAEVAVQVFNGSGRSGLAASAATGLTGAGFVVAGTGNADSGDYEVTEIRYAEGDEARARALAAAVPGAKKVKSPDAVAGTVQLVLGTDFNGVGQAVTAPEPTAAPTTGATEKARTAADTSCIN